MDKEKLKHWAIALEYELRKQQSRSKDVADLCAYRGLMTAIGRAKMGKVSKPIHLRLLAHFYFEMRIPVNVNGDSNGMDAPTLNGIICAKVALAYQPLELNRSVHHEGYNNRP